MPIYEYYCKDCLTEHEIRSSEYKKEAEMPYVCIKCGSENTKRFPNFPARWVFCELGAYRQDERGWNSDSPDWNYTKYLLRLKRGIMDKIDQGGTIEELEALKKDLDEVNSKFSEG